MGHAEEERPPSPPHDPEHTCHLCDVRKACSPLKTMAIQVAGMYQHLPALIQIAEDQKLTNIEHDRRLRRVEGAIDDLHTIVRDLQAKIDAQALGPRAPPEWATRPRTP